MAKSDSGYGFKQDKKGNYKLTTKKDYKVKPEDDAGYGFKTNKKGEYVLENKPRKSK